MWKMVTQRKRSVIIRIGSEIPFKQGSGLRKLFTERSISQYIIDTPVRVSGIDGIAIPAACLCERILPPCRHPHLILRHLWGVAQFSQHQHGGIRTHIRLHGVENLCYLTCPDLSGLRIVVWVEVDRVNNQVISISEPYLCPAPVSGEEVFRSGTCHYGHVFVRYNLMMGKYGSRPVPRTGQKSVIHLKVVGDLLNYLLCRRLLKGDDIGIVK